MDSDSEPELLSLISQLMYVYNTVDWYSALDSGGVALIIQIISLINSIDLDSQPKPESKLMSLTAQATSIFTSMDLDSQPAPLEKLITFISQKMSLHSEAESEPDSDFMFLFRQTTIVSPEPELISLIHQIMSLVISTDSKWKNLISACPQVQVKLEEGNFHVLDDEVELRSHTKWECLPRFWKEFRSKGKATTHFFCKGCNGKDHQEYEKAPLEIKHPFHPKHSLHLVKSNRCGTKKCYCCDESLRKIFYYCSACDYAMNITCVEKPPVLSIEHQKWHEHELALFPRKASLTCDLCGLADSSCPFYICGPCDFVAHQSCLSLPRVIRISRHHHRISFTPSFDRADWSCGVCRKKINNEYGGYACITKCCLYAAHSRCATQSNVWDGEDLENVPEEVEEEEVKPFVRISSGIIQHFSHEHHHMRLNVDTNRDYDEDKQCQACLTPIYFGNFYSCIQCDFILHEDCANLSRKIYNPIHPHTLTLVGGCEGVMEYMDPCIACFGVCKAGFYYECSTEECDFRLHVQCATISEPLVHGSHIHPLFLTSKPGEGRPCSLCEDLEAWDETFNCIECDFALCFGCAILPQTVRYKHDKHILILSYGKEISSTMMYWCEVCEKQVTSRKRFYRCDEYCCVTLHIECLIGDDLHLKPGSSWFIEGRQVDVLTNKPRMSRPICSYCERRCPHKIVLQWFGFIFCSHACIIDFDCDSQKTP